MTVNDPTSPAHYQGHPSHVQCFDVIAHLPAELANVIKYCWRWQHKNGAEDLRKALWYLDHVKPDITHAFLHSTPLFGINLALTDLVMKYEPEGTPLYVALDFLKGLEDAANAEEEGYATASDLKAVITSHIKEAGPLTVQKVEEEMDPVARALKYLDRDDRERSNFYHIEVASFIHDAESSGYGFYDSVYFAGDLFTGEGREISWEEAEELGEFTYAGYEERMHELIYGKESQ